MSLVICKSKVFSYDKKWWLKNIQDLEFDLQIMEPRKK